MKREPRLRLRRTWFLWMVITGVALIVVGSAAVVQQLNQVPMAQATKFAELLLAIPLVPWLARVMPTGNSPLLMSWGHAIIFLAAIPFAFCAWRFHYHRERYRDEERARDLSDI